MLRSSAGSSITSTGVFKRSREPGTLIREPCSLSSSSMGSLCLGGLEIEQPEQVIIAELVRWVHLRTHAQELARARVKRVHLARAQAVALAPMRPAAMSGKHRL